MRYESIAGVPRAADRVSANGRNAHAVGVGRGAKTKRRAAVGGGVGGGRGIGGARCARGSAFDSSRRDTRVVSEAQGA